MKLWLLRPISGHAEFSPWEPWYDKAFGFVVGAETEARARELASKEAGDEGGNCWLTPELTRCEEIGSDEFEEGVILRDLASA